MVFKEVCKPVRREGASVVFNAIADTCAGKQAHSRSILRSLTIDVLVSRVIQNGWVHRDISIGNILCVRETGLTGSW